MISCPNCGKDKFAFKNSHSFRQHVHKCRKGEIGNRAKISGTKSVKGSIAKEARLLLEETEEEKEKPSPQSFAEGKHTFTDLANYTQNLASSLYPERPKETLAQYQERRDKITEYVSTIEERAIKLKKQASQNNSPSNSEPSYSEPSYSEPSYSEPIQSYPSVPKSPSFFSKPIPKQKQKTPEELERDYQNEFLNARLPNGELSEPPISSNRNWSQAEEIKSKKEQQSELSYKTAFLSPSYGFDNAPYSSSVAQAEPKSFYRCQKCSAQYSSNLQLSAHALSHLINLLRSV